MIVDDSTVFPHPGLPCNQIIELCAFQRVNSSLSRSHDPVVPWRLFDARAWFVEGSGAESHCRIASRCFSKCAVSVLSLMSDIVSLISEIVVFVSSSSSWIAKINFLRR